MTDAIEIAQTFLGNINRDARLKDSLTATSHLTIVLPVSARPKGRIRGYTNSGLAVGIIKERDRLLHSGDLYQTDSGKLLLINLEAQEVLAIDLTTIEATAAQLVRLGHVLGNHHYPIAVEGDRQRIVVPLTTDKATVENLIRSLNIPGLIISYQTRSVDSAISFSQHTH